MKMRGVLPWLLLCGGAVCCVGSETVLPAADARVRWEGRTAPTPDGGVSFDWEGVSASLSLIAPWSYLIVNISDACQGSSGIGGGSRWSVVAASADGRASPPGHRVATFFSGPRVAEYLLLSNPGGGCDPGCSWSGATTVTLTRLTESRVSGCAAGSGLAVAAFATDGGFGAAPAPLPRRLEFVGDSITAGDLNDGAGAATCGNNAVNDDVTLGSGARVCAALGAECMHTAWGGITLGARGWGMRDLYPFAFSGARGTDAYGAWDFARFPADAVVVNLGTNDGPVPGDAAWIAAYVAFGADVVHKHYADPSLVLFLAYGPMTDAYAADVVNVTAQLAAAGVRAHAIDLMLPHALTGCYGHPSAADNAEIAAKAAPQIAAAMGWGADVASAADS